MNSPDLQSLISAPDFDPNSQGGRFWYEQYQQHQAENQQLREQLETLQTDLEQLKEKLQKLTNRTSENSSQSSSQDGPKKKTKAQQPGKGRKRGPKFNHRGKTRNHFERVDHKRELTLDNCPKCGGALNRLEAGRVRHQQIAELVSQAVEIWEYERPEYECPNCGWSGHADLPLGCREGFSYGALLSSFVGWLGYGGNLSWAKQRYVVETILGIPLSQGSLSKMHQWFCQSLYPSYEQWWSVIQHPGVRCVDETSYRVNGVNYWLWVATSAEVCVLFLVPTRSSAEVKSLLGEEFQGILSSDCWSAYGPQSASAKQKCLAHIERELKAMQSSRFVDNRHFADEVFAIFHQARQAYRAYHQQQLSLADLHLCRVSVEAQLQQLLDHPPKKGWPADAQNLANRFRRHWDEWFTFLSYPQVKPDNNDAERALRPVVVHRKVSGGARSHWGGQLVAMMFSFLETMRLQGNNAVEELSKLLSNLERSPPQTQSPVAN